MRQLCLVEPPFAVLAVSCARYLHVGRMRFIVVRPEIQGPIALLGQRAQDSDGHLGRVELSSRDRRGIDTLKTAGEARPSGPIEVVSGNDCDGLVPRVVEKVLKLTLGRREGVRKTRQRLERQLRVEMGREHRRKGETR